MRKAQCLAHAGTTSQGLWAGHTTVICAQFELTGFVPNTLYLTTVRPNCDER